MDRPVIAALLIAVLAVPVGWGAVGATHDVRTALGGVVAAGGLLVAATWATETGGPFTVVAGLAAVAVSLPGRRGDASPEPYDRRSITRFAALAFSFQP